VSEMKPESEPVPEVDDLGLTPDEWMDLQLAYNFGLLEPQEGTVEAEAFRRMDAFARSEVDRIAKADAADRAYAAWAKANPEEAAQRQAEIEAEWTEPLWDSDDPRAHAAGAAADLEPEAEP
jgi:hypothetical protein